MVFHIKDVDVKRGFKRCFWTTAPFYELFSLYLR